MVEWPPFGKSGSVGLPYVLFVISLFVIVVISHFGFDGETLVLIASVAGHCLAFYKRKVD